MSSVKIGKIAPFPPLPGQPYPPSRNHPRWKELYRLHDEWLMKYWPFSSEKKRARIPFQNLAGFSTWCAPAADFDRMVWGGRIAGIFFLADDYVDTAKMHDRIPGFKKAATGTGPLHPEDRAEICHDIVFRAVKASSHPRTFNQFTKCTHEWWDSNIHEPFRNLDQYLAARRVNIAIYFSNSYFRWTLNINLTDEQVNHPLMREAEGIVSDHVGLTNDLFSYVKETMSNSDDTNVVRLLQDTEGLTYEQAKDVVTKKIRQKEQDYIPAGLAVLNDPELGKDPEVHRWIACMPYCMGGNLAWSQTSARYNVGDIPGGVPFPSLSCQVEETPADEVVDDTEESLLRDRVFSVKDIPPPDFSLDSDPIEGGVTRTLTESALHTQFFLPDIERPRPVEVGILGMEVYFPRRCVRRSSLAGTGDEYIAYVDDREDINSVALTTVSSLLRKYNVDPRTLGHLEVCTETSIENPKSVNSVLMRLFAESGNTDVEGLNCKSGGSSSTAAVFNAVNWIESSAWDGRNALVFAGDVRIGGGAAGGVAILIGPKAPLVLEPSRGSFMGNNDSTNLASNSVMDKQSTRTNYITALEESYKMYKRKRTKELISLYANNAGTPPPHNTTGIATNGTPSVNGVNGFHAVDVAKCHNGAVPVPEVSVREFDYLIFDSQDEDTVKLAHSRLHCNEHGEKPDALASSPAEWLKKEDIESTSVKQSMGDYRQRVLPSLAISKRCGGVYTGSIFGRLVSLLEAVPSYDIFEHRISMFEYGSGCASSFFTLRVRGDTKYIRDNLNLNARLEAMRVTPPEEYAKAQKLCETSHGVAPYNPVGALDGLWSGMYYLESISAEGERNYAVA